MKYEFNFTEGCVAFSYLINDVEFVNYNDMNSMKLIIDKLIRRTNNRKNLYNLIFDVISNVYDCGGDVNEYKFDKANLFDYIINEIESDSDVSFEDWKESENKLDEILNSLSDDDMKEIKYDLIYMVDRVVFEDSFFDAGLVQWMLIKLVKNDPDTIYYCSEESCDCCGDYIESYKLTIEI